MGFCKRHKQYPDDNDENLCKGFQNVPHLQIMWDFPIIIPCNKYFCVHVNIARYKNGTRERGSLELKIDCFSLTGICI